MFYKGFEKGQGKNRAPLALEIFFPLKKKKQIACELQETVTGKSYPLGEGSEGTLKLHKASQEMGLTSWCPGLHQCQGGTEHPTGARTALEGNRADLAMKTHPGLRTQQYR